jgi:hypothetical protein
MHGYLSGNGIRNEMEMKLEFSSHPSISGNGMRNEMVMKQEPAAWETIC